MLRRGGHAGGTRGNRAPLATTETRKGRAEVAGCPRETSGLGAAPPHLPGGARTQRHPVLKLPPPPLLPPRCPMDSGPSEDAGGQLAPRPWPAKGQTGLLCGEPGGIQGTRSEKPVVACYCHVASKGLHASRVESSLRRWADLELPGLQPSPCCHSSLGLSAGPLTPRLNAFIHYLIHSFVGCLLSTRSVP